MLDDKHIKTQKGRLRVSFLLGVRRGTFQDFLPKTGGWEKVGVSNTKRKSARTMASDRPGAALARDESPKGVKS